MTPYNLMGRNFAEGNIDPISGLEIEAVYASETFVTV
jgi:hypothetical protein